VVKALKGQKHNEPYAERLRILARDWTLTLHRDLIRVFRSLIR